MEDCGAPRQFCRGLKFGGVVLCNSIGADWKAHMGQAKPAIQAVLHTGDVKVTVSDGQSYCTL